MAVAQTKDGRWYVAGKKGFWPDEPVRTRQYFGRGPAAEQAARRRDAELGGIRSKPSSADGPAFAELAAAYLREKRFAPKSHRELVIRLAKIILPAIGHRRALRLNHADMDAYVDKRRTTRAQRKKTFIRDSTIRREVTDIKSILNWSVKRRPPLIPHNPVSSYSPPAADDAVIMPPTADEAAAIYEAAPEHLKRAITLAYYTGLRPGAVELLRLSWADISMEVGIIRIRSASKGGPRLRDVPIHDGLKKHLIAWAKADKGHHRLPSGYIIQYHGKPIAKIQTAWKGTLERAKIKRRLRPYDLRHYFVTRALEAGADIGALAEIVGSRPETLRRHYQHVSRELTRRTVALVPELAVNTSGTPKRRLYQKKTTKTHTGG